MFARCEQSRQRSAFQRSDPACALAPVRRSIRFPGTGRVAPLKNAALTALFELEAGRNFNLISLVTQLAHLPPAGSWAPIDGF